MSCYKLCKTMIEKGNYEYQSMIGKLDAFLLVGRITPDEYTELVGLMDAQKTA
ncbi:hypothetical protein [Bacillus massiliigorillae]|uniref:hypothetical protein n=1 Tax=Bacillus massiliigorillae TaxID=1243664 RepID=UPI0003A2D8BD|nr:hypothetical protein [Bacillus massiliigorillae]